MPPEPSLDSVAGLPPAVLAAATEALAQGAGAREQALDALCAAHPGFETRLRGLFVDFTAVDRLLDRGYGRRAEMLTDLGPYRVVRRLGEGAFGEVFLCRQTEPMRRDVAVKVLRAGVGDRATLLRFEAERQLIASLQHPAIAQVFDAGTLADGRPFFVMDAIDGIEIDRFCDEHALDVDARIQLFGDLCRGVQHAHDRGIVHRDLKPANVLVVEVDGQPRPKVIDFGIAKVLQGSSVLRPFDTEAGRVVGTPGYMSPEQQKGCSDEVDARADVFCLGVMLYELLCGQLPWPAGAAMTDADPQRPSTRVSVSAGKATVIARHRATEPRRLAGRLRGELDWIVLKCLQRERERRYQTVKELVDDLDRHRRGEPVRVGPPSRTYRLRKYARRHRSKLAVVATLACGALLGTWGVGWYAEAATRSETRRTEELDAARVLFVQGRHSATDHAAMASVAESLVQPGADWRSLHHGIRGFAFAILLAVRGSFREALPELRRSLADACERLLAAPVGAAEAQDPLHHCAVAQARVRLAALIEPGERADALRRAGLAALDEVGDVESDVWWDERLWLDASLVVARADVDAGALGLARNRLERIDGKLRGSIHLLEATRVWLHCCERVNDAAVADTALGERACDAAVAMLARAVDAGARRRNVLAIPGVLRLQDHPRGRELLARVPE